VEVNLTAMGCGASSDNPSPVKKPLPPPPPKALPKPPPKEVPADSGPPSVSASDLGKKYVSQSKFTHYTRLEINSAHFISLQWK